MPLYFFLSGLFFKDYGGFRRTTLRKIDRLIIPFCFFAILYIFILSSFKIVSGEQVHFSDYFDNGEVKIISLWFLLCLFWQSIICYFITSNLKHNISRVVATLVLAFIGICISKSEIRLPMYIDSALTCFPFYYFGYAVKTTNLLTANYKRWKVALAIIALVSTACIIAKLNQFSCIDFYVNQYSGSIVLSYIQSILIVIALLLLIKEVKTLPLLSYIGRYSIILLGLHGIFAIIAVKAGRILGTELQPEIIFLIILTASAICIKPLITTLPNMTAQKNLLSKSF